MTRFARVHGANKPSFNKVAEEATPWEVLRQPVEESSHSEEEREEILEQPENEDKVVKKTTPVNTVWCEFEDNTTVKKKSKKGNKERLCEEPVKKKQKKQPVENEDYELKQVNTKRKKEKRNNKDNDLKSNSEFDEIEPKRKKKKHRKTENGSKEETSENDKEPSENDTVAEKQQNEQTDEKTGTKDEDKQTFKRRKPDEGDQTIVIDGKEIRITRFDGFYVKEDDAKALTEMRKKLRGKNVPKEKIKYIMKKERRNAEKALARIKKKVCFNCRCSGHNLSACPKLASKGEPVPAGMGICFKCGSTEHSMFQCKVPGNQLKFATCFICKEQGHLSKNCPDNPRGLYPQGGGCRLCGDVTHFKQDCPKAQKKNRNTEKFVTINTFKRGKFSVDDDFREHPAKKKLNIQNNYNEQKPNKIIFN